MKVEQIVQQEYKSQTLIMDTAYQTAAVAMVAKLLGFTPIRASIRPGESAIDFEPGESLPWQTAVIVKLAGGCGLRKWTGETLKDFGPDEDRLAARRMVERATPDADAADAEFKILDARAAHLVETNWKAIGCFAMHLLEEENLKFEALEGALDEMLAHAKTLN